jgi:hypothetical protein
MHGSDRESEPEKRLRASLCWYGHFNKSEMALFSECTDRYAQKLLDTADIVREAILQQLRVFVSCQRRSHPATLCVRQGLLRSVLYAANPAGPGPGVV